ncbi:MAG: hypothetical protein IKM33_02470 [Clostridia bacterium]|nr:hypothetical protein [Clostridia bacterium]
MKFKLFNQQHKFKDSPNTRCFTCCHILDEYNPILYVSHDEDGERQFLCGKKHDPEEARIVALSEIIRLQNNVIELSGLKCGEYAEFQNSQWIIHKKTHNP